jgi:hypothetical protein
LPMTIRSGSRSSIPQAHTVGGLHAQAALSLVCTRAWPEGPPSARATARSPAANAPPPPYRGHLHALLSPPPVTIAAGWGGTPCRPRAIPEVLLSRVPPWPPPQAR